MWIGNLFLSHISFLMLINQTQTNELQPKIKVWAFWFSIYAQKEKVEQRSIHILTFWDNFGKVFGIIWQFNQQAEYLIWT